MVEGASVDSINVNPFRDNLKTLAEIRWPAEHRPLKVTRRSGDDFVGIGAEDWERKQETLCVPQNSDLMRQIAESMKTRSQGSGYRPSAGEADESLGV
jgi:antitoxin YefM